MPAQIFWSTEAQRRKYHRLPCKECGKVIWTSSIKGRDYVCITCRKDAGQAINGREGSYTTLAAPPAQKLSFGRCRSCDRDNQDLANELCPCCRFYGISDTDPDKSANARMAKSGQYDRVRRRR